MPNGAAAERCGAGTQCPAQHPLQPRVRRPRAERATPNTGWAQPPHRSAGRKRSRAERSGPLNGARQPLCSAPFAEQSRLDARVRRCFEFKNQVLLENIRRYKK